MYKNLNYAEFKSDAKVIRMKAITTAVAAIFIHLYI